MAKGFPLAGLLRLRHLQEDQAAAELARANADRRRADKRRRDTENMLAGTVLPEQGDELAWQAAIAGRAAMTGLVGEATAALAEAGSRVDGATAEWSQARTRATTLDKLFDRHVLVVRAEELRVEQLVLDEAAARGHATVSTSSGAQEER